MSLPEWAPDAPHRNLYASDVSGVVEQYAWDRETDTHRQVTDRPNGTLMATLSPDGDTIWWFADTDGDEFGSWVVEPFAEPFASLRSLRDADKPLGCLESYPCIRYH